MTVAMSFRYFISGDWLDIGSQSLPLGASELSLCVNFRPTELLDFIGCLMAGATFVVKSLPCGNSSWARS